MKKIDRTIRILSEKLDMIPLPGKHVEALLIADDLETLREARMIIQDNEKEQHDEDVFDDWDHGLLSLARNAHYSNHRKVRDLTTMTYNYACHAKLKEIADHLRDIWRKENL